MRKIWAVIRREFLERVRSKWFIIGTVLSPVLMFGIIAIPILVGERGGNRTVAVLDATTTGFGERLTGMLNGVGTVIAQRVTTDVPSLEDAAASLARRVELEAIDGFIIVTDAVVDDGRAEYRGRILRIAVFSERLKREGVDPSLMARARIPVNLTTKKIRDGKVTEESGEASFFLAYAMWFLL